MRARPAVRISKPTVRTLSKAAELSLDEARSEQAGKALQQFTNEQRSLYDLDLTDVEPPFAFDPRWD